ncbi:hypothetical protein BDV98DRAFT_560236 [Pterulicium gracile]|uniref:Uncharacterized protein n=1 Tax=Pterulicium gracile TaxID=1884261 RepID=A0A5C3QUG3_9AGAR|nr:hypothetical protein BDV98DRAFT_560236 [Pterula gracilis]
MSVGGTVRWPSIWRRGFSPVARLRRPVGKSSSCCVSPRDAAASTGVGQVESYSLCKHPVLSRRWFPSLIHSMRSPCQFLRMNLLRWLLRYGNAER